MATDHDTLVRLAGEQTLLKQQIKQINAEYSRNLQALRNLSDDVGRKPDWLDEGIALLRRIDEHQRTSADAHRRLAEYRVLTGID